MGAEPAAMTPPGAPLGAPGAASSRALLEVEDLEVTYGRSRAVEGISLSVGEGEVVGIVGPNGAGKSSTLRAIMGAVRRSGGQVTLRGKALAPGRPENIARLGVAMVPEGRHLFASMTVKENLELGRLARRRDRRPRFDDGEVAELFPVAEEFRDQRAGLLSGGQQQQVAIARALLADPDLLLLDEPSLGLSPTAVAAVFSALAHIHELGVSILLVEQRAEMTLEFCSRSYVLVGGRIRFEADRSTPIQTVIDSYFGADPSARSELRR